MLVWPRDTGRARRGKSGLQTNDAKTGTRAAETGRTSQPGDITSLHWEVYNKAAYQHPVQ
jgi:hypothetical protein